MDLPFRLDGVPLSRHTRELLTAVTDPACTPADPEGLESVCDLAYGLYVDGRPAEARATTDLLASLEFEGDYDRWTWVELALALRGRIGAETGSAQETAEFTAKALRAVEYGDEGTVRIKRKVHARFLAGSQLRTEEVRRAVESGDQESERGWRLGLLRSQVNLEQFGGSQTAPLTVSLPVLRAEIEQNLAALRALSPREQP